MRSRNITFFIIILLAGFIFLGTAQPGFSQNLKIASLDFEALQNEWVKWQNAETQLENFVKSKRSEILQEQRSLMEEFESLSLKKELLPPEQVNERRQELQLQGEKIKEKEQANIKAINQKKTELLDPLMEELKTTVEQIAREENYAFIFIRRYLFYVNDAYDITNKVIARLNS